MTILNTNHNYEDLKRKYENTKPIRGRSIDVRPIGERRRDWEQVVRVVNPISGEVMYGGRFHNTNVFLFRPNGNVIFCVNGYHTPTTREFINEHCPVAGASISKSRMWMYFGANGTCNTYVNLPDSKPLEIEYDPESRKYKTDKFLHATQRVVDRNLAKEQRERVRPFLDYCRVMLSLSDGFIAKERVFEAVRDQELSNAIERTYVPTRDIYESLVELLQDESKWETVFLQRLRYGNATVTKSSIGYHVPVDFMATWFGAVVRTQKDFYTTREIEVGTRHRQNLVL